MANTVILGAGIIGTATAYHLARHQPPPAAGGGSIHLVEAAPELFASASGYAGGFLARDWFGPDAAPLGALSFDEHRRLAAEHGGAARWGYAASTAVGLALAAEEEGTRKGRKKRTEMEKEKKKEEKEREGGRRRRNVDVDVWCREDVSRAEAAAAAAAVAEAGEEEQEDARQVDLGAAAPAWLRMEDGDEVDVIAEEGTTAQVDPLQLCRFLLQECVAAGVRLHQPATAVAATTDVRGELASVRIATIDTDTDIDGTTGTTGTETDVPCTRLVVAAGAWSPDAFAQLFPDAKIRLPLGSLAGHSLVLRSPRWAGSRSDNSSSGGGGVNCCHAVFASGAADARPGFSPEVFSRADGVIYVAGLNSAALPLPRRATDATTTTGGIDPEAAARLRHTARRVLGRRRAGEDEDEDEDDLEVVREGLCFRPVHTSRGTPVLDRIPDRLLGDGITTRPGAEGGVFLAAGHGPWGISMSLGTGKVMAEMIQGRPLSADVSGLALGA
ncbi:FAD dependent oxidoreductase [Xylariaceae sp. FL0804]|nr:FAD dependent oxidoreductase [Xylariaceae sp. FL0804]